MAKKISKGNQGNLLYGIVLLIVGILLAIGGIGTAGRLLSILMTVIGVLFIVHGILSIVRGMLVFGIVEIVIGVLILVMGWTIAWIALLVLAVLLIFYGLRGLFVDKSHPKPLSPIGLALLLQILAGIMIILLAFGVNWAWSVANVFYIVCGVLMAIDGIMFIVLSF